MWRKGNYFALLVHMQISAATVGISMELSPKIKNGSAFWPSGPLSGNTYEGTQNPNLKEHNNPYICGTIIYNHQAMEALKCPSVDEWIKWLWDIYTMEYYLAVKTEANFTLCDCMDGPGEHYAKWNKATRERQTPYDFIHMWNLFNKLNKHNRDRFIDREQNDSCGGGEVRG